MKSIDFPGAFLKIGEGQEQYHTIHGFPIQGSPQGEVIAIYELSDEEVQRIVETKKIFYSRWTFGQKFQPMQISTEPIQFTALLIFDGTKEAIEVVAEVGPGGVTIPGYIKTPEGKFVKE